MSAWGMPADMETVVEISPEGPASVRGLIDRLAGVEKFSADVVYTVSLPSVDDDVVYDVELASVSVPGDTLLPVDYLIKWKLPRKETTSTGFLAYFDGHHYRYRDNRLQEYHYDWDSIPFLTGGGVHRQGQFVDLLPQSIAAELGRMIDSDEYTVGYEPSSVADGHNVSVVTVKQIVKGFVGRNYKLIVDNATGLPLSIENEYNPSQISEQTVSVRYSYPSGDATLQAVTTEDELMAMYPEVFEKFRENNYRIENMRGLPMPGFSLPTLTGERYTRAKGEAFRAPAVIAIIDPAVATSGATVEALRKARDMMPRDTELILAFMGSNTDLAESVAGSPGLGEHDLISAKSLARDCGTSVFPTVLIVEPSGIVTNVMLGFNNSIAEDVIQSVSLIP